MQWERAIASIIVQEYEESAPTPEDQPFAHIYQAALHISNDQNEELWSEKLLQLVNMSHERMRLSAASLELNVWRKIYTDSSLLRGIAQSLMSHRLEAIATLDCAIIIAGPYGIGRLKLILDIIQQIQSSLLSGQSSFSPENICPIYPSMLDSGPLKCTVPCLPSPPSFFAFQSTFSRSPFILRNYAANWPALRDHPWKLSSYLRSVGGPGRIVPVEVGSDYRSENWEQKLTPWDDFLSSLDFEDQPSSKINTNVLYLAQHDLTRQFPTLREDIIIPDYIYASLDSVDFPDYHPPANDEQILFNTWLGPNGTVSPAHIDPYHNIYVQVVGHKSIWLAPPMASASMYPFSSTPESDLPNDARERLSSSLLGNTSRVDVFAEHQNIQDFPDFVHNVIPVSMTATLAPGDILFFPPGWWHAMRSLTTSFSFSMWF